MTLFGPSQVDSIRHIQEECCVLHPCFGAECSSGPPVGLIADHLLRPGPCSRALGGRAAEPRGRLGLSKDHISPRRYVRT